MANLLWKLTPSHSWPTADATVDSCEWVRYHDHLGGTAGHYQVKFTYQPDGGQVNHGEFCHQGVQHIAPYSGRRAADHSVRPQEAGTLSL